MFGIIELHNRKHVVQNGLSDKTKRGKYVLHIVIRRAVIKEPFFSWKTGTRSE